MVEGFLPEAIALNSCQFNTNQTDRALGKKIQEIKFTDRGEGKAFSLSKFKIARFMNHGACSSCYSFVLDPFLQLQFEHCIFIYWPCTSPMANWQCQVPIKLLTGVYVGSKCRRNLDVSWTFSGVWCGGPILVWPFGEGPFIMALLGLLLYIVVFSAGVKTLLQDVIYICNNTHTGMLMSLGLPELQLHCVFRPVNWTWA